MTDEDSAPLPDQSREAFAEQLHQLEAFIASADAEGDELPPEAVEMVARLREVVLALDGLTSTLGDLGTAIPATRIDPSPVQPE